MDDETKRKGATKGDGGLVIYDCHGDKELKGDEWSGDEDLREG